MNDLTPADVEAFTITAANGGYWRIYKNGLISHCCSSNSRKFYLLRQYNNTCPVCSTVLADLTELQLKLGVS